MTTSRRLNIKALGLLLFIISMTYILWSKRNLKASNETSMKLQISAESMQALDFITVEYGGRRWSFNHACVAGDGCVRWDSFEAGVEAQIASIFILKARQSASPLIIDIGMNSGFLTLLASAVEARVIAFEPQPGCFDLLKKATYNVHPQNIFAFNMGVGSAGVLQVPNSKQCHGHHTGVKSRHDQSDTVEVITIDPIPIINAFTSTLIHLVKIDTEGAEIGILQALMPLILGGRIKAIVVELIPNLWQARGYNTSYGIATLETVQQHAHTTILLTDPKSFSFNINEIRLDGINGPLYTFNEMAELIFDRSSKNCGCNLYFQF